MVRINREFSSHDKPNLTGTHTQSILLLPLNAPAAVEGRKFLGHSKLLPASEHRGHWQVKEGVLVHNAAAYRVDINRICRHPGNAGTHTEDKCISCGTISSEDLSLT